MESRMKPLAALMFTAAAFAAAPALAQAPAPAAAQAAVPADPAQFLAANAKAPGVTVLPSGLQYKVVAAGPAGPSPKVGDVIKVQYEGKLTSGKVFDATPTGKSALMQLAQLVPGWMEALPMMHVGDDWILYIPPALGYGADGAGPIPPDSVLVFRLKLVGMLSAD
jgi:FKBP-type peptidyl-prolyl cis-trans isomerase FklB